MENTWRYLILAVLMVFGISGVIVLVVRLIDRVFEKRKPQPTPEIMPKGDVALHSPRPRKPMATIDMTMHELPEGLTGEVFITSHAMAHMPHLGEWVSEVLAERGRKAGVPLTLQMMETWETAGYILRWYPTRPQDR